VNRPRLRVPTILLDWALVFAFAAVLIWPLYKAKYLNSWASIESTFIADARFLADHWPHPNWQPNWYCGTRTDYVYPPALRYGTAALVRYVPRMLPVRAYHLYIAFFYCFGVAGVYLLVRWASKSRGSGLLAGIAIALVSPSYLFMQTIRDDAPLWMPYRLNVLIRYGEGPHMTSLAWIGIALFFSMRALTGWRPGSFVAAAVSCAMVVSNNFYGATALAMLYPILLWSVYITHLDKWVWVRGAAIPVLAYSFTAFWLVPSYVRITLDNMQFVSQQGNVWSRWVALALVVGFLLLSDHLARGKRDALWLTFLGGAAALFTVNVLGNHYLNFRIIGEPSRLVPELDLLLICLAVEVLRRLWYAQMPWPYVRRGIAAAIVVVALASSATYVGKSHRIFERYPDPENRVEYQLQDWVAKNLPGSRVVPAGSVRFWYNVWNDLPQLGGGSEQGLLNPHTQPPQWQIFLGPEADISRLWLQILGVDAIIVNGKNSREHYHDYVYPDKFKGVLPVLYDNGAGDTIHAVPRRYPGLARVVNRARFNALPEIPGNGELPQLQQWYDVVEKGPDAPTETRWDGTDAFRVKASVRGGQSVWIAESFDANWRAYSRGQRLPMRMDKLGLMVIDAPPGDHDIRLEFPTPFSYIVGRCVTGVSVLATVVLVWMNRRHRHDVA
jgi:hypothetical protein